MMTLNQMLAAIENSKDGNSRVEILTSGATHITQDKNGNVYGFKGKPSNERDSQGEEWLSGDGIEDRCVIWFADLPAPENWKKCIWELP